MTPIALVVDDSMLIRHAVRRFLERRGFTVGTANDGAEALEALKTFRPHVIFTDLQMPRISGYELVELLKNCPETASIPLVILAAKPSQEEPFRSNADWMIYKDLNIDQQLAQSLDNLLPAHATVAARPSTSSQYQ